MLHEKIGLPVQYRKFGIDNHGYTPVLTSYIISDSPETGTGRRRPLVLICPGGAYSFTCFREAEPVALRMNSMGYHACVLDYSCAPMDFPAAFLDLCEAVRYVRAHTDEWCADPSQIIICGFSAGGHLAASLGVWWNTDLVQKYLPYRAESIKPDALLLCYPVITSGPYGHQDSIRNLLGERLYTDENRRYVSLEHAVNADVPPVFVWHTAADTAVPVQNTLLFVSALAEHGIPFEYHVFAKGAHGLGLADEPSMLRPDQLEPSCACWPELFNTWFTGVRRLS